MSGCENINASEIYECFYQKDYYPYLEVLVTQGLHIM